MLYELREISCGTKNSHYFNFSLKGRLKIVDKYCGHKYEEINSNKSQIVRERLGKAVSVDFIIFDQKFFVQYVNVSFFLFLILITHRLFIFMSLVTILAV